MQCVAVCCGVLQGIAMCRHRESHWRDWFECLEGVAVCCSVLQCVAVCCKLLQGIAMCRHGESHWRHWFECLGGVAIC